jgi:hypothetical protein
MRNEDITPMLARASARASQTVDAAPMFSQCSRFEDQENPWLGISHRFALATSPEQGPFEAFQLVLSDPDGRLPWEPGYDERLRHLQRALWEPAELAEADAV